MTWLIFLVVAIPLIGVIAWVALDESFVRIEPGQLGLLLVHGRATGQVLEPGPHWVPALRRRMVQSYPSLEHSFSAGADDGSEEGSSTVERSGPWLQVMLGDRNRVRVSYTVRFRLDREQLIAVHERFGPDGIWSAVRDVSAKAVRARLGQAGCAVESIVGPERQRLGQELADLVTEQLAADGVVVTSFFVGDLDLGRAGEVIEATARARLELEREQAEAAMRLARAEIDADLAPFIAAATDAALRYREVDSWRELARSTSANVVLPSPGRAPAGATAPPDDGTTDTEPPAAVEEA